MTRKFTFELGDEAPFGEFLLLWPFEIESADLVASELKPVHIIGLIYVEQVLFRIGLKELTLSHQLLLLGLNR